MKKISVIIPCYSVGEELLEIAVNSIQNQTYLNWEIIFIDDCSPLKEWESQKLNLIPKEKLKIINNQKRLGAGKCRNIGIDNSSGDLILFLDADDKYASNDFFEYLIKKFQEYSDLDIILFNHLRFEKEDKKLRKTISKIKVKENYYKNINFESFNAKIYKTGVWICLKKEFINKNNIRNLEKNTPHEDVCFLYQIIWHNPNLLYTTIPFYLWRVRRNSTTGMLSNKKYYEIKNINIILNDINELPLKKNNDDIYIYISRYLIVSLLKYGYKRNKKYLNIEINKNLCKKLFKSTKNWDWPKLKIINKFKIKWLVSLTYRIYYTIS